MKPLGWEALLTEHGEKLSRMYTSRVHTFKAETSSQSYVES